MHKLEPFNQIARMGFNKNKKMNMKKILEEEEKFTSKSLQEPQFSVMLRNREKIDGFKLFDGGESHSLRQRQQKNSPLSRSFYDARQSLAWDQAFFTSPGVLEPEELKTLNISVPENATDTLAHREGSGNFCESNSRVSLAWDNAFFTSPGVLDPEELSLINHGCKKSEKHLPPRTGREILGSVESNLTVNSSNSSLEGLETSLFKDLKSPTWRPNGPDGIESKSNITRKTVSKRLDASNQARVKPTSVGGRRSFKVCRSKKLTNDASLHPQAQKQATKSKDAGISSSLKTSKILRHTNHVSGATSKRASKCANSIKSDSKTMEALTGQRQTAKEELRCFTPTAKSLDLSSKRFKKFNSAASGTNKKSRSNSLKRFPESKMLKLSTPGFTLNTSLASLTSNKYTFTHSTNANYVRMPNFSPCTSPATFGKNISDGCSLDAKRRKEVVAEVDASLVLDINPRSQSNAGQGSQDMEGHDQCGEIVPTKTPPPLSTDGLRTFKPTELRLPSPKLGFFDEDKSMQSSPIEGLQFHTGDDITLAKTRRELSDITTSHRAKFQQLEATGNQDQQDSTLSPVSRPLQPASTKSELDKTPLEIATPTEPLTSFPSLAFKLQNVFGEDIKSESCDSSDTMEHSFIFCSEYEKKKTEGLPAKNTLGGNKSQVLCTQCQEEHEATGPLGLEHQLHKQFHNNKENLCGFESQVNNLCRHVKAIDLSNVTEIKAEKCLLDNVSHKDSSGKYA